MTLGKWISGTAGLNLDIIPFEQRPDAGKWTGGPFYRVKDVFSTRGGSWEPSAEFGAIEQWAVDAYWSGQKFDGAGGDHNFFVLVLDEAGNPIPGKGILFGGWSAAGFELTTAIRNAKADGSENIPVFGSYSPDLDQHGGWSGTTVGRADVLVGVGMPWNNHISVFLVLQAAAAPVVPPVEPPVTPPVTGDLGAIVTALNGIGAELHRLALHLGA